jgi:hypothetical protein
MKNKEVLAVCLIVFGVVETTIVWPFWYNHIWSGLVLHGDYSYLHIELTQQLTALLIIVPAFLALLLALLISRKSKSKPLRVVGIIFFSLFMLAVLWWIVAAFFIATHPPVGG